jgi:hypothetical protein
MKLFTNLNVYLSLFILFAQSLSAQNFSLKGRVTTSEGIPISGANVMLLNDARSLITDEFGSYLFNNMKGGLEVVKVVSLGFESKQENVSINKNVELNFSLNSSSIELSEVNINNKSTLGETGTISGIDKLLRPVNTSQELLQLVPGLLIAQHAGGGKAEQIFLRGFDTDHGTDFNISVDGMPVNMVSHAHGQGYADFHFVIPETIDKLKVYKGPYTARFGDFSTSGTGEFFTKNAIVKNEIKAEAGMFDTFRTVGMFKLLDKKHFLSNQKEAAYIAGEYVFTNSYFDNKQNFNRYNIFGKYSGMLNENNLLSLSVSTFYADWDASGQVPQRAIDKGIIERFGSINSGEGGQTKRTNVNAIITTTVGNNAIIKNQLYYVNYHFNLYSDFTFFLNDSIHGDEINQTDNRNIAGYNGSIEKDFLIFKKNIHTTFGLGTRNDLTHLALKHTEKRNTLDTIVSGIVSQQNNNAFLEGTLEVNKHFSINAGTRLDYFRFKFNDDRTDSLSGSKDILRASPKLNFYYTVNNDLQLFLKSGIGFHSNDARSVVVNNTSNSLPKAYGSEIGSEFKVAKRMLVNIALWGLYLESELVYVGDEGTVETNFPTQRIGTDLSIRYQLTNKLFADVDLNYNHGRLIGAASHENYIPLAPGLTSIAGLTYKQDKGINGSLRYRFIDSRPANEQNSVIAKGYFLMDVLLTYKTRRIDFGISVENLLNAKWNQAQFDTESRLYNETEPVSEIHFTPGTPFFAKGFISFTF